MQRENVLIIGGSITGLTGALALKEMGFAVTVVERDASPNPNIVPAESNRWMRRGAPHALQPHVLTARLRNALHEWYPGLVAALRDAGVWELGFAEMVHPVARDNYRRLPEDSDITILMSRRTTLELVMRRYVEQQAGITILDRCEVTSLITERAGAVTHVRGVRLKDDSGEHDLLTDVVVDASGRATKFADELRASGCAIAEEFHGSNSTYYTRHYRLLPGQEYPGLYGLPAAIFADMTVGAFPGDCGSIVVTIGAFKDDPLLSGPLQDAALFERICRGIPRIAEWIDPARSEPTSGIMGWANMDFLWRSTLAGGTPQVLGFFFAGDTVIRSNPKYGRGCTCGTIGSRILAQTLAQKSNPAARAQHYEAALRDAFRREWEELLAVDRMDYQRFRVAAGLKHPTVGMRLRSKFQDHLVNKAMLAEPGLQRALLKGFFGLTAPSEWTGDLRNWLAILRTLYLPRAKAEAAAAYGVRPSRREIAGWIAGRSAPAAA